MMDNVIFPPESPCIMIFWLVQSTELHIPEDSNNHFLYEIQYLPIDT